MKKRTQQLKKLVKLTRKLREATLAADAALDQGLDAAKRQQHDMEDLHLAAQRLIDVRVGRSQAVGLDEVERRLGLGD